eukprot:4952339-Pyramimonas_sp.AAC.1
MGFCGSTSVAGGWLSCAAGVLLLDVGSQLVASACACPLDRARAARSCPRSRCCHLAVLLCLP